LNIDEIFYLGLSYFEGLLTRLGLDVSWFEGVEEGVDFITLEAEVVFMVLG
jgi:hypothetical protein